MRRVGFLVAALNRYRPLDDGYRGFVELVAGHIAAGIGSARSYQAQQRRAEELAELDRAKTTFFSNISHEFRTPLTLDPRAGRTSCAAGRAASTSRRARSWRSSTATGCGWPSWSTRCWTSPASRRGGCRPATSRSTWQRVTAELASVFRSAIERAGLTVHGGLPAARRTGVPGPRHVGEGGPQPAVQRAEVHLRRLHHGRACAARAPTPWSRVTDTGIGVPAAEMPRLFERFHRIETARARSNEGSGIGLALVKELVGLHGGTITADSTGGRGHHLHHPAALRRGPPARRRTRPGRGRRAPSARRDRRPVRAGSPALAAQRRR